MVATMPTSDNDGLALRRISSIILLLVACLQNISPMLADRGASTAFVSSSLHRSRPLAFRHRMTHANISSSMQVSDDRKKGECTHVYLRLSPLVGGPTFLPLHVEVMIITHMLQTQKMDTIYIRSDTSFSSMPFYEDSLIFHRFDFLPENPTDPSTLARLFTLQSVPGTVRHRRIPQLDGSDDEITTNTDRNGMTILIPVGSEMRMEDDIVSTATNFKDEYSDSLFKEIRLLGGKNCLSFALDLLSYVESTVGLKRVTGLTTLDVK